MEEFIAGINNDPNKHHDSNCKDINITQFTNEVGRRLNYIGITKVNTAAIKKAYRQYKTVSDTVSIML